MRGIKLLAIAGTATLATLIGGVLPANAVTQPRRPLHGAQIWYSSDKGEFIGQGNPGITLTAPMANARTAVSLARTASGELTTFALSGKPTTGVHLVTQMTRADNSVVTSWTLDLPAPVGLKLTPGHYALSGPGFAVDGRSCTTLTGYYDITVLRFSATGVAKLSASWMQYCNGSPLALRGFVQIW